MDARQQHYGLLHRMIATVSRGVASSIEYRSRSGLTRGLKRHGGLGFVPEWIVGSRVLTHEVVFWRAQPLSGQVVYDIGAFQGLTTIFFASRAAQVIAFEPNPESRRIVERNLALNALRNVTVVPMALGDTTAELELRLDPLMPGGASIDTLVGDQLSRDRDVTRVSVPVRRLDEVAQERGFPIPDVLKVDVEGFEGPVLEGGRALLAAHHPSLYLEMHGADDEDKARRVASIVATLRSLGYEEIHHLESGRRVEGDTAFARRGHLVVQGRRGRFTLGSAA